MYIKHVYHKQTFNTHIHIDLANDQKFEPPMSFCVRLFEYELVCPDKTDISGSKTGDVHIY